MRVMHVIFLSHEAVFRSFDRPQRFVSGRGHSCAATESVDDELQTPALPPHLAWNIEQYQRVLLFCVAHFRLAASDATDSHCAAPSRAAR